MQIIVALTNGSNFARYHKILDDSIAGVCMLKFVNHRKAATDGILPAPIPDKENTDETK